MDQNTFRKAEILAPVRLEFKEGLLIDLGNLTPMLQSVGRGLIDLDRGKLGIGKQRP